MTKKIKDYEILDHGVENADYFTGCGTSFTEFDDVFTGIGNNQREALENALEDMASCDYEISNDLENELGTASDRDTVLEVLNQYAPRIEYHVTLYSHNGMNMSFEVFDSIHDAEIYCKEFLNKMKDKDFNITCLEENEENQPIKWELESLGNANGLFVTDLDGILVIETINQGERDKYFENSNMYHYMSVRVKG